MKCTELKKDGADIQRGKVLLALEGATPRIEAAEAALIAAGWDSTNCAEDGGRDGTLVVFFVVDRCDVKEFRAAWKKAKAGSLAEETLDEGFDAEDAAEVERERSASIAADIEASRQRTMASLAALDGARGWLVRHEAAAAIAFKKGDDVTIIGDYDSNGTAYFQNARVVSCGKKQMVLEDAAAKCLELGAEVVESERAIREDKIRAYRDNAPYVAAMRRALAELHEPRAHKA